MPYGERVYFVSFGLSAPSMNDWLRDLPTGMLPRTAYSIAMRLSYAYPPSTAQCRACSLMVERAAHNGLAAGSIPAGRTNHRITTMVFGPQLQAKPHPWACVALNGGHDYTVTQVLPSGTVVLYCRRCGKQKP